MKDNNIAERAGEMLPEIISAYDDWGYPEEFTEKYVITECLAERSGIDTFVAEDHRGKKYVAKCYDRSLWSLDAENSILKDIEGEGLPKFIASYSNEDMLVSVREYVEGVPLDQYAEENELSRDEIVGICVKLCGILACLHHRPEPIIHRDIKPRNVIISDPEDKDGSAEAATEGGHGEAGVTLIDFDIARRYNAENDTDTIFFGTQAYAPPEQYGFSQTDARADIYSLGVLLRYLLTGSTRDNKNVSVYKPLARIIDKCTAFSPDDRYGDIDQVRRDLEHANPGAQKRKIALRTLCCLLIASMAALGGVEIYRAATWTPFSDDAIPAFVSDSERIADAVAYMNEKYNTEIFSGAEGGLDGQTGTDAVATIGLLKKVLIDVYGLDAGYVNAPNNDIPNESDEFFLPWTWADDQTIGRGTMVYVAVKAYDPSIVADWSSLKDDNGEYPGERVALAFAEETGIMTGVNRPDDITIGEMALILANTDRVFTAAAEAQELHDA